LGVAPSPNIVNAILRHIHFGVFILVKYVTTFNVFYYYHRWVLFRPNTSFTIEMLLNSVFGIFRSTYVVFIFLKLENIEGNSFSFAYLPIRGFMREISGKCASRKFGTTNEKFAGFAIGSFDEIIPTSRTLHFLY